MNLHGVQYSAQAPEACEEGLGRLLNVLARDGEREDQFQHLLRRETVQPAPLEALAEPVPVPLP